MDPTRQGRGAYYKSTTQRSFLTSSPLVVVSTAAAASAAGAGHAATPLQMNPRPQFQPHQGGYIGDQSSTRAGIPTDANISSYDALLGVPMPGSQTSVPHSPSTAKVIGSQRQYLPQHGSGPLFSVLGYEFDGVFNPHASVYRP